MVFVCWRTILFCRNTLEGEESVSPAPAELWRRLGSATPSWKLCRSCIPNEIEWVPNSLIASFFNGFRVACDRLHGNDLESSRFVRGHRGECAQTGSLSLKTRGD